MRTGLLANEEDKPFVMGVGSDAVGLELKTHVRTVPDREREGQGGTRLRGPLR